MAKNKEMHDYYQKCVDDAKKLKESMEELIAKYIDINMLEDEDKYNYYKMVNEINAIEAKIKVQEYMMSIYNDRIAEYMPIYERESQETNANWLSVWSKACELAEQEPFSGYAMIVKGFPENASQELKNEVYKALNNQLTMRKK